jgi:uncharacterized protein (DUF1501 family)
MFDIFGSRVTRTCSGMSRRDFVRVGAVGTLGLSLADWLKMKAQGQTKEGKAKSVIQIWLGGGPPQTDMFDPKPEAGEDYSGPLKNPIATNAPGMRISELLPLLAKQADKFSLLRSVTHNNDGHETAAYIMLTGTLPSPDIVYPCIGSVVALKRGYNAGYKGLLPPYITLTYPLGRFSEAGFLGSNYKTFTTGGDPNAKEIRVQGLVPPGGMTPQRLEERHTLLQSVDSLAKEIDKNETLQTMTTYQEKAYGLVMGEAKKAFDMSQEKDEVREKYGRNHFGQSCLLSRRLVENGVPFITVNWGGWDTHTDNFGAMKKLLPQFDQGLSSLLEELSQRGLLASTIISVYGEFGRTPKVYWEPPWNGGRHHYGPVFSALVAGGGFKGGVVVGSTDARGEQVKDRPIFAWDLSASMYKLMGIEPTERLPHPQGCVAYVTPLASGAVASGGLLTEIM